MQKTFNFKFWLLFILIIVVVLPAGVFLFQRLEGEVPSVTIVPAIVSIGKSQPVKVIFSDLKSGLRSIRIALTKDGKEKILYEKEFPLSGFGLKGDADKQDVELIIESEKLGFSDGRAVLQISVRDHSWRNWWHGNGNDIEKPVMIDSRPPEIDVLTRMHNINQGGAGLVIYKLSETCPDTGVMVGDHFYPAHAGYFDDADIYMALFALDYQQGAGTKMFIKATDRAGNSAQTGFPHYIRKKVFRKDVLPVSDHFLDWKMPEFKVDSSGGKPLTNLEKYLYVNKELRKANYEVLAGLCKETDNTLYWQGAFLRLPNSARRAGFADYREYQYNGQKIDRQVHMGIDLASVQQADVPASNAGKVVFADSLGIYGKTVFD